MTTPDTAYADPTKLDKFFEIGDVFGFHNQDDADHVYNFGFRRPALVNETNSQPNLTVTNSDQGGYITLINPARTPDLDAIKGYISGQFGDDVNDIQLRQVSAQVEFAMKFSVDVSPLQNIVPFDDKTRIETTHSEGVAIVAALQQHDGIVYVETKTTFNQHTQASLSFVADNDLLRAAVEANVANQKDLEIFLNTQVASGALKLNSSYSNHPSTATVNKAKEGLFNMAGMLILSYITNAASPDSLPNPFHQEVTYQNGFAEQYRLVNQLDIADGMRAVSLDQVVSFSQSPLPEPSRTAPPPPPDNGGSDTNANRTACDVKLGFNPQGLGITGIDIVWGNTNAALDWPSFSPISIETKDGPGVLTITTSFASSPDFTATLDFAKVVTIDYKHIGYCEVSFLGDGLSGDYKDANGSATYRPDQGGRSTNHSFSFSGNNWTSTWLLHTGADTLNGTITYQWQGKPSKGFLRKDYNSGEKTSTSTTITLTADD